MSERSPYTIKTLILYLTDLEKRDQYTQALLQSGENFEPSEDPSLLLRARLARSRAQLDDWSEIRRIKTICVAAGFPFDAQGMSQSVACFCQEQRMDLREVGNWSLNEFANYGPSHKKCNIDVG